jgi:hypothetical protein
MSDQPVNIGTISSTPLIQQEFLRWLSDPNEYFIWVQHTLHGDVLVKDSDGKEAWELPKAKKLVQKYMKVDFDGIEKSVLDGFEEVDYTVDPQMSDMASVNITNKLRYYLNQFTFHADYEDEQIRQMMMPIADDMDEYLKRNQREFGISDDNITSIAIGIKTLIYTAFKMSKMRAFYTDVLKIGIGTQGQQKSDKVLGIFPKPSIG